MNWQLVPESQGPVASCELLQNLVVGLVEVTKIWSLRLDFEAVRTMRLVVGTSPIVCADLKGTMIVKDVED